MLNYWNASHFRGTYKVEDHQIVLDLTTANGRTAIYTKRQQVTFLQDNVFAIQDQAWGDGDIFANYTCNPGVAVDRYKEGYRWKILISLRRTYNRNETEQFNIERTVTEGFTTPIGNFQTQIDHPTQDLTMSVIFPESRHPTGVTFIEQNAKRTHLFGNEDVIPLSRGRMQYQWHIHKPHLYESYILRWEW
ncbi:MAG: hypothetical protein H0X30_06415 [Anaerolineae bacterium]|nr:hypothetical protein [Anaerolineae bacterium]